MAKRWMTVTYTALAHIPVEEDDTEISLKEKLERGEVELLAAEVQDLVSWDNVEFNEHD